MTDVKVRFEGITVSGVIPEVVPDLFAARPLAVMAHFSGEPRGEMVVTGRSTRGPVELRVPIRANDGGRHKALPLLWARHRLAELSDAVDPATQEANRKETTEVALQHGLLSAYTSFVAVDERVRNGQPSIDVEQPLPLPAGMNVNELGGLLGTGGGSAFGMGGLGIGASGGGYGKIGTKGRGASPVSVSPGAVMIMGSLDKNVIKRVISSHLAEVRYCYERELVRTPGLAGKVVVKFTIGPDGLVQTAMVSTSDLGNAAVEKCLAKRAATWVFPRVKGGGVVEVNYPFVFKVAGEN
jgi:TonB family protein